MKVGWPKERRRGTEKRKNVPENFPTKTHHTLEKTKNISNVAKFSVKHEFFYIEVIIYEIFITLNQVKTKFSVKKNIAEKKLIKKIAVY